jgi:mycothiol maleylpyruvate isomerase-like protein
MKYLLTSAGIKNTSIHNALLDLLGKPIAEASALCIPTAGYGHPQVQPFRAWRFISGREPENPMCELGWKSVGVLELTALPSIDQERWVTWVRETEVSMNKSELLHGLREEYRRWEALLGQIGEARMDQPGAAADWSIKDIIAHLTGWRHRTVARLQAAQRGEGEPPSPWPAHLERR